MENFPPIINWENVFQQSNNFKKNKPFKFAFIEEFIERNFYEKLYETYPKFDETWVDGSTMNKSQLSKYWGKDSGRNSIVKEGERDPRYSKEWNQFKLYVESQEFVEKLKNFSGIPVNKLKTFQFMLYRKGGFQLPHIHNVGPSTLICMIYFSKNWQKGDPGGTYISTDVDESSIIFEPYNLDNSIVIFHDGPNAAHGVRLITKDVERRAIQLYYEEYTESGWTGFTSLKDDDKNRLPEI
jgi:hypothetical protein